MKILRPFRFGVTSSGMSTRDEWLALARKTEAQGYSTLVISDHIYNRIAPMTALMAAADATTTLRVGSYLFGNDFRNPVLLAQEAATIDLLSGGRFELGLGTGWFSGDYEQTGIPFDTPGVRVDRLQEAIPIVKGCWTAAPFTFSGDHYKVKEVTVLPKPTQAPRPPILIGGGSRRVLSFAAREADIVGINFKTTPEGWVDFSSMRPDGIDEKLQWVRDAAADRIDALELNVFVNIGAITDNRRELVRRGFVRVRETLDDASADAWLESPMVLVGTVDQNVEALRYRRERFGLSYIVLRQDVADDFASVVERLAGM